MSSMDVNVSLARLHTHTIVKPRSEFCLSYSSFVYSTGNYRYKSPLEIRHPPIIAPIATVPPAKRLVLWPTNLASLGVDLALKLWWRTSSDVGVKLLALAVGLDCGRQSVLGWSGACHRVWRLVDLDGGDILAWRAESSSGLLL